MFPRYCMVRSEAVSNLQPHSSVSPVANGVNPFMTGNTVWCTCRPCYIHTYACITQKEDFQGITKHILKLVRLVVIGSWINDAMNVIIITTRLQRVIINRKLYNNHEVCFIQIKSSFCMHGKNPEAFSSGFQESQDTVCFDIIRIFLLSDRMCLLR